MKFKVGDKVRVRKDLIVGEEYGTNSFVKDMEHIRGKIVTIRRLHSTGYYIEEYGFGWTDEMFEGDIQTKIE